MRVHGFLRFDRMYANACLSDCIVREIVWLWWAGCMSTTLSTASIMYVDHDNVFKQHNATPVAIKVNRRFNGEVRKSFRCTILL